jgi:hypothetical protein
MLFRAVCTSLDLTFAPASKRSRTAFIVRGPDAAAHDRLNARFNDLKRGYEIAVIDTATAYIRQHCGVEFELPPH